MTERKEFKKEDTLLKKTNEKQKEERIVFFKIFLFKRFTRFLEDFLRNIIREELFPTKTIKSGVSKEMSSGLTARKLNKQKLFLNVNKITEIEKVIGLSEYLF